MDFAILGPLRAVGAQGPVDLKAPKQRALLATLLLAPGDGVVGPERLIDAIWGDDPPATATKALQVHVSQLRRVLAPDEPILTRPAGYAIAVADGGLDLERFRALVAGARRAREDGDAGAAAGMLRDALALFRGPPLADVPLQGAMTFEPDRLADLRLQVLEERIDLDLLRGEHAAVGDELQALAAEHPYRERVHGQLMLALYRSGRQAEALEAYRSVRRALVDDLGLEPGRELQRLEAAILAHDPALDLDARPAAPRRRPASAPSRAAGAADAAARPRARARGCGAPPPQPGRAPAHAHRAGRHRQDAAGARARARAGGRVRGRRGGGPARGRGRRG